jgi:hypothetical protein
VVVIAVGTDNILKNSRNIATRLDICLSQIPRDLATDTLCHLIGVLINLFIFQQLLLLGGDFFGPVSFLNAQQIKPDLLSYRTIAN